jgi:3-oxoacyl-[acyl-carrier protein] reductase
MDLALTGRTAVITGGSMGIGRAIGEGLAAEGVNLVLLARGEQPLKDAAEAIQSEHGVEVEILPTDLTDRAATDAAAAATAERFGTVHILVNTAGGRMRRPDRQVLWDDEDWMGDIDAKTVAMLRTIRAFHPHLDKSGKGTIINVAGVAGVVVWDAALTHGINNAAMIHTTRYLARDLAKENITCNVVAPGLIRTEWREELWAPKMAEQQGVTPGEFVDAHCEEMGILLGRWGDMKEVADMAVFLASDRARYITGARIDIDGGMATGSRP